MSREKSIFEQMGGTYTEKDGILYSNILIDEEQTETMQDKMTVYNEFLKEYEYRKKYFGVEEDIQKKQRNRER